MWLGVVVGLVGGGGVVGGGGRPSGRRGWVGRGWHENAYFNAYF